MHERRISLLHSDERTSRAVFTLLVGSAFSLWRAVFLSGIDREWPDILDKTERLLEGLLATSAEPSALERKAGSWLFAYYLNSAIDRIAKALTRLDRVEETPAIAGFKGLQRDGLVATGLAPAECWRIVEAAQRDLIAIVALRV